MARAFASLIHPLPAYSFFVAAPVPFYTWKFDKQLDGWVNDLNNWDHRWSIEKAAPGNGILCLSGTLPTREKPSEVDDPFAVKLPVTAASPASEITARLWSRKIPAQLSIKCLTLVYKIAGTKSTAPSSLKMLQRQEG